MNQAYCDRVCKKYNPRHATAFVRKAAENRFLAPFQLSLKKDPPLRFGENQKPLTLEEEFGLFAALHFMKYKVKKSCSVNGRYMRIYLAIRNRILSANWDLVQTCINIKRYSGRSDLPSLTERGCESLISAVDGFDPWHKPRCNFNTYAQHAILKRFIKRKKTTEHCIPLDEYVSETAKAPMEDHQTKLWEERLSKIIASGAHTMDDREMAIVQFRFFDEKDYTLKDIAEEWSLSKERVRQIQVNALIKLRKALQKDPILR